MFKFIRTAALSALIGAGVLAAIPATAQADGVYFGIGSGGPSVGMHIGPGGHSYRDRDRDYRDHDRGRHHDRDYGRRAGCSASEAVNKAQRLGVRHARVAYANQRVIGVNGRQRGHRVNIVFANALRCPVVG